MNGILGSNVLEVAIGLALVYLLLSLICTAVNEWVLTFWKNFRAKNLGKAIEDMLDGQQVESGTFHAQFLKHPLVAGMDVGGKGISYLSPRTFSTAIMDLVTPTVRGAITSRDLTEGINALQEGTVKQTLVALLASSSAKETSAGTEAGASSPSLKDFQEEVETWFESVMDRTTGVFKRQSQRWAMLIAVIVTILANADTFKIAGTLWSDSTVRAAAVKLAEQRAEMPRPTATVEYKDPADPLNPTVTEEPQNNLTEEERQLLGTLLGWDRPVTEYKVADLAGHLPGWLITAIAVSLGAPFWFDVLNRFMSLRNAGRKPAGRADEGKARA